jgi:ABC-type branched-subunit amino acid transport system substrate-binding protein
MTRSLSTAAFTVAGFAFVATAASAPGTYDPGASDIEIKLGNTWPFSGPVSVTSPVQRQMVGYFHMINDEGGVNGRKINFIALDDGYNPAKTVEDTRRLVEQDQVLLMYGQLGTPTNVAVQPYLNSRKVPQLFITTGANSLIDPKKYPWTMGLQASYALESTVFAKYILAERPNAKIGILYQDDDFGTDRIKPFMDALGPKAAQMVVAKVSYQVTDPSVTSQMISLKSAGADTVYLAAQSRAAAQAISVARDQVGWDALLFLPFVASAKSVVGPVGDDKLKGVISSDSTKDPTDPNWANDAAAQAYLAWNKKYTPAQDQESNAASPLGYLSAQVMTEVLKRAGDNLTRVNVMNVATSLKDLTLPLVLPGITLNTSPENYYPMHTLQLKRYDGTRWVLIGKPISD